MLTDNFKETTRAMVVSSLLFIGNDLRVGMILIRGKVARTLIAEKCFCFFIILDKLKQVSYDNNEFMTYYYERILR